MRTLIQKRDQALPTIEADLLGRRITCMTLSTVVKHIHQACMSSNKIVVANYNIHAFNMSIQYAWFYDFLQQADISHCDGSGIILALRLMGYKLPHDYRVSYSTLMPKLLEACNQQGHSVYLLGSKNNYLKMALYNLRCQYPSVSFSGHHGYFSINDLEANQKVINDINHFKPRILIVGMGMPLQEYWVLKHREQLDVNAILVGGAVIDRLAGHVNDCPDILSRHGLEWLYRLAQEPRRLLSRYVIGNPAFLLQVALAKSLHPNRESFLNIG